MSYSVNSSKVDLKVSDPFVFDGEKSVPVKKELASAELLDKQEFFRQGWPVTDELLRQYSNGTYLQLVVNLIHRDPVSAALFSGRNEKTSGMSTHFDLRPPCIPPISFTQFWMCLKVLAKLKTPRRSIMNYIVYEDFARLYDCVVANAKSVTTLVNEKCYGLGLFPTLSYVNHSCDPNCVLLGSPLGMHLISIKEISAGDELTISYIPSIVPEFVSSEHCGKQVNEDWGFFCVCEVCRGRLLNPLLQKKNPFVISTRNVMLKYTEISRHFEELLELCEKEPNDPNEIMTKCENMNKDWGHVLSNEPQLLHVMSKKYVRLLQPGRPMKTLISHRYLLWVEAYMKSLEVAKGSNSYHTIFGLYYRTIYLLLFCDAIVKKQYVFEQTEADADVLENCRKLSTETFDAFAKSYVELRSKCRTTLGTHYFIWFEFATFPNMDRWLMSMENLIFEMEKERFDKNSEDAKKILDEYEGMEGLTLTQCITKRFESYQKTKVKVVQ